MNLHCAGSAFVDIIVERLDCGVAKISLLERMDIERTNRIDLPDVIQSFLRRLFHLAALIGLPVLSLSGQIDTSRTLTSVVAALDSAAEVQGFSGVFLFAALDGQGGRVLDARSHGIADRASAAPVTLGTQFITASTAKSLTAVAILRLVQEHRISLDEKIGHYLPDSLFPAARGNEITARELLTHTAGMGDLVRSPAFRTAPESFTSLRQLLMLIRKEPAVGPIGAFRYGDSDYLLLGAIIEQVTGRSFADAMDDLVFRPADMAHSGFHIWPRPPGLAHGYTTRRLGAVTYPNARDSSAPLAANDPILPRVGVPGSVAYTTAEDLMRFADGLATGRLLAEPQVRDLWSGHVETGQGDQNAANAGYGLGFFVGKAGRQRLINHGGTGPGIDVAFDIYPDLRYAFIALSNEDPPGAQQLRSLVRQALSRLP